MKERRSFLIDTNIIIQLEDPKPVHVEFSEMVRRCQEHGVTLYVHEASEEDIKHDQDVQRRTVTLSKIAKFPRISGVPTPPDTVLESRFGTIANQHDRIDVQLLNALERNVVDFLVTEDLRIHQRARRAGLQERVLRVREALDWLIATFEPTKVVTDQEVAATRASDAAVAADDAREVTQAEESDVSSDPTGTPRGINPMLFRQPPVPDDSADGNVEIRFKHPE
jgi:DNA polymerase/3'-5' exonuclease PolX